MFDPNTEHNVRDRHRSRYINLRQRITGERHESVFAREFDLLRESEKIEELSLSKHCTIFTVRTAPILQTFEKTVAVFFVAIYYIEISGIRPRKSALRLNPPQLKVSCIESGRKDGGAPFYVSEAYTEGFCFGKREKYIKDLLSRGELFQAVSIALDSLWYLNEGNRPQLLEYKKVPQDWRPEMITRTPVW